MDITATELLAEMFIIQFETYIFKKYEKARPGISFPKCHDSVITAGLYWQISLTIFSK